MEIFSPSHAERSKGKKIAAIDIDDVLADSIPSWIKFCNYSLGTHYTDLYELKKSLSYYRYRLLKYKYRISSYKANLPLKEHAREFLVELKDLGYTIIIITKRPDFCSKMTYYWLDKNKMIYDEVIFSKNKHIVVLERFPGLKFMVEDNLDIANHVSDWGYRVFLMNNKYNSYSVLTKNVIRVLNLEEVMLCLKQNW